MQFRLITADRGDHPRLGGLKPAGRHRWLVVTLPDVPSAFEIRAATLDDVDELVRLRAVMLAAVWGEAREATWAKHCAEILQDTLATESGCAFVADVGESRLVGGGVGLIDQHLPSPRNLSGRYGKVMSMVTEPAWRGQGIATHIMRAILDWFQARGVTRVSLYATAAGEPIYRSLGFSSPPYPELRWTAPADS